VKTWMDGTSPSTFYLCLFNTIKHMEFNDTNDSTVQHHPARGQRGDCFSPLSGTKAASGEVFFSGPQNPTERASLKWYLYRGPKLNMDFFYIYTYEAAPREISVEDSLMHLKQKVQLFTWAKWWRANMQWKIN